MMSFYLKICFKSHFFLLYSDNWFFHNDATSTPTKIQNVLLKSSAEDGETAAKIVLYDLMKNSCANCASTENVMHFKGERVCRACYRLCHQLGKNLELTCASGGKCNVLEDRGCKASRSQDSGIFKLKGMRTRLVGQHLRVLFASILTPTISQKSRKLPGNKFSPELFIV